MRMKKYDPAFLKEKSVEWEKPCSEAVSEDKRDLYEKRILAFDMYADGHTVEEISNATSISSGHIHELIEKCLMDDGNTSVRKLSLKITAKGCIPSSLKKQNDAAGFLLTIAVLLKNLHMSLRWKKAEE